MAEPPPDAPTDWKEVGARIALGLLEVLPAGNFMKAHIAAQAEAHGVKAATVLNAFPDVAGMVGKGVVLAEHEFAPLFAGYAAAAVAHLFDSQSAEAAYANTKDSAGRKEAAKGLANALFAAITGDKATMEPGQDGARRLVAASVGAGLEAWYNGWIFELITSFIPIEGVGHLEQMGNLNEAIVQSLGLGRLVRRALAPLIDVTCVTPMKWDVNKRYRPEGLTTSLIVREFLRGKLTRDDLDESLARQGYAPAKIEALIHDASQRFSDAEIRGFVARNIFDETQAIDRLKDNGYPAETADQLVKSWRVDRVFTYADRELSSVASAFVAGDIDQPDFSERVNGLIPNEDIRASFKAYAEHTRAISVKHLSHAEIRECVERGIANPIDYRAWLQRENYAPDEALMLELLLTAQLRGQQEAEKEKARIAAERADAKRVAAEEKAARAAALAAKQARTPAALADVERAVVRGILPIATYDARLVDLHYSPDDRAFLVELLQQQRDDYLAAQEKRAHAADGDPARELTIAEAERATLRGILGLDDYRRRLVAEGLSDADAAILVQLVAGERADRQAAAAKRAQAEAAAAARGLSLAQQEKAVRQGLRSPEQYGGWLAAQGFPAEDVALLVASLRQDMADADAAARLRAAVNQKAQLRGIGLAPLERAVKLGVRTLDEYAAKLRALEISPDDQVTLVGVLRAELAQLDAARAKRNAPPPGAPPPGLTREEIERAVVDGSATMDDYRAWLAAAGYADDDVDLLVQLLLLELQAARQPATAP